MLDRMMDILMAVSLNHLPEDDYETQEVNVGFGRGDLTCFYFSADLTLEFLY